LPVEKNATRRRRSTGTSARPSDASRPRSAGRSTRPAASAASPRARSSPARRRLSPLRTMPGGTPMRSPSSL